jgi:DNA mismatch repair protein MSH5
MNSPETMEELRSLIQDEIVEETCSNNIIAINYSNNQLGVAGYEELQNTIYGEVFEVSLDDCETTLLSIKNFFNPGLFLVHPSILANTSLLKFILQGTDGTPDFYSYKTLRTSAWNEMMTTNILYNDLKIRTSQGGRVVQESAFETIRRLQIDLDLEKIRLKQVLGALLTYLQDTVCKLDKGKIVVSAIKEFPVVAYMRMDTNSFRALQIFSEDFHPNWISGKGRSKEGFSIFGLFDRTHSILGRRKLREWMSKPFADMDKIVQRQNFISFTLDELNKDLLSQITFNLKNIFDIPRILVRIKKVEANYGDWCKLYSSLTNSISILDKFEAHKSFSHLDTENVHFINELSRNLNIYVLRNLAKLLASVIDFHSTLEAKRIQIHEGFDRVLDQKREIYGSIESLLFEAGQKVIDSFSFLEVRSSDFLILIFDIE